MTSSGTALITGVAGQDGSYLAEPLLDEGSRERFGFEARAGFGVGLQTTRDWYGSNRQPAKASTPESGGRA